jgi:hypothetical protein
MVYEYAIDPKSLNNWHRLRFIADAVGVPHGRLISDFPGSWSRTVTQSFVGSPIEQARLLSQYQKIKPHLIPSAGRVFDGERKDWLSNAESAHESLPFRAIVAAENPRSHLRVLIIDDIDGTTELWRTSHSLPVPRDAAELADTASLLLQIASDIVFVDPNFVPTSRFLRPFEQFLQRLLGNRNKAAPRVRLIVKEDDDHAHTGDTFEQNCLNALAKLIPSSLTCELVRVREKSAPAEKLHNRYVLTDWGGIDFGVGLDDDDRVGGQSDDVHLLEKDHFDKRWHQYAMMEAFDVAVPAVTIVGTKAL